MGTNTEKKQRRIKGWRNQYPNGKNRIKKVKVGNRVGYYQSVGFKMKGGFLALVVLIVALGVISYQKASSGMIEKYEQSTNNTLAMTRKYFEVVINGVASKAAQLNTNGTINQYYGGKYKDDPFREYKSIEEIQKTIVSIISEDKFINEIYLFANYGQGIFSEGILEGDYYEGFSKTPEGSKLLDSFDNEIWAGYHSYLDERTGVATADYSLSCIANLKNSVYSNIGFIVIDIDMDMVKDAFREMNLDEGSIVGFITEDDKEVLIGEGNEEFSFLSQRFFHESRENQPEDGSKSEGIRTVSYQNSNYRYIYSLNGEGGISVCALIPEAAIIKQAQEMKSVTVVIVVVACLIAGIIGTLLSTGISGAIRKTNQFLSTASSGDLTGVLSMKRKDEFSLLSLELNNMISGMKELVGKMALVSGGVNTASDHVVDSAELLLTSTIDITNTVNDISGGVVQQAQDVEGCLMKMEELSNQVNRMIENTVKINVSAKDTRSMVSRGMIIMGELGGRAEDTNRITHNVIDNIEALDVQSADINKFVDVINEISEQTKLLSLNASIEAARAGEHGRGFAVVAHEINKLAEQSNKASHEIANIMENIRVQTRKTVGTAREAEEILKLQKKALAATEEAFKVIDRNVGNLADSLVIVMDGIEEVKNTKDDTLSAIESISAISEETASAAEELSATAENQLKVVEALNVASGKLQENAEDLKDKIKAFKI